MKGSFLFCLLFCVILSISCGPVKNSPFEDDKYNKIQIIRKVTSNTDLSENELDSELQIRKSVPSKTSLLEEDLFNDIQRMNISCQNKEDTYGQCKKGSKKCICSGIYRTCHPFTPCCADYLYRHTRRSLSNRWKCLSMYHTNGPEYLMVDSCRKGWSDAEAEHLCHSNGEDDGNVLLTIPVTSPITGIPYKNYFCSVCNEDADELLFSYIWVIIDREVNKRADVSLLSYNKSMQSWVVFDPLARNYSKIGLYISPSDEWRLCTSEAISSCSSNWKDLAVAEKCTSYTLDVYIRNKWYKNPHCALCNFENPAHPESCDITRSGGGFGSLTEVVVSVLAFKDKTCGKDQIHFSGRCKDLKCASAGYVMKDSKCESKADLLSNSNVSGTDLYKDSQNISGVPMHNNNTLCENCS